MDLSPSTALITSLQLAFGINAEQLLEEAKSGSLSLLTPSKVEFLASRLAHRRLRDSIAHMIPSREEMIQNCSEELEFSVRSPYFVELALLKQLVENKDLNQIIARYPIRESGILNVIAKALRFTGRVDFERAVLQSLRMDDVLKAAMRSKMGPLGVQLE